MDGSANWLDRFMSKSFGIKNIQKSQYISYYMESINTYVT